MLNSVEKVDRIHVESGLLLPIPPMSDCRHAQAVVTNDEYIFVLGGYNSQRVQRLNTCEIFDPSTNR